MRDVFVSLRPSSGSKASSSPPFWASRSETKPDCRDDGAAAEIERRRGGERARVAEEEEEEEEEEQEQESGT